MNDILLTPIRLNELETLIENSVRKVLGEKGTQKSYIESTTDQLLTVPQAAQFLSLAVPTIYSLISKGELPVMKRSKRCYFSKEELVGYLKAGRKKTNIEMETESDTYLSNHKMISR